MFQGLLGLTERYECLKDLAFEALHMLEDVEEIAGSACGIENAGITKAAMKVAKPLDRVGRVTCSNELGYGRDDVSPIGAQRLNNRRDNQTFNVGAWSVVRTQLMAFRRV